MPAEEFGAGRGGATSPRTAKGCYPASALRRWPAKDRHILIFHLSLRPLLMLSLPGSLTACLIAPIPHIGHQVGPRQLDQLRPGVSTRADVLRLLGEPAVLREERLLVYDWTTDNGFLLVAGGAGMDTWRTGMRRWRVLAAFDSTGRLTRYEQRSDAKRDKPATRSRWRLRGCSGAGTCAGVVFDSGGRQVVAREGRRSLWRWSVPDSGSGAIKGRRRRKVPPAVIEALGFAADTEPSPDGALVAGIGTGGAVILRGRGASEPQLILSPAGRQSVPHGIAFSPDGRWLVVVSDAAVEWWEAARLEPAPAGVVPQDARRRVDLLPFGPPADEDVKRRRCSPTARFSPDGRRLATLSERGVVLWDVASGMPTDTLGERDVAACGLAFSPDSRWLAASGFPETLLWWLAAPPAAGVSP